MRDAHLVLPVNLLEVVALRLLLVFKVPLTFLTTTWFLSLEQNSRCPKVYGCYLWANTVDSLVHLYAYIVRSPLSNIQVMSLFLPLEALLCYVRYLTIKMKMNGTFKPSSSDFLQVG